MALRTTEAPANRAAAGSRWTTQKPRPGVHDVEAGVCGLFRRSAGGGLDAQDDVRVATQARADAGGVSNVLAPAARAARGPACRHAGHSALHPGAHASPGAAVAR